MTAHAMKSDIDTCLELGMNGHVPKPISIDSLKKALSQWLPVATGDTGELSGPEEGGDLVDSSDDSAPRNPSAIIDAEVQNCSSETDNVDNMETTAEQVAGPESADDEMRCEYQENFQAFPIWDKEEMLERMDGCIEVALEIVDLALEFLPQQLEELYQAVNKEGDLQIIHEKAHSLNGAVSNIGGTRSSKIVAEIERTKSRSQALVLVSLFEESANQLLESIRRDNMQEDNN